jgi:phage terminase Nu1 subunit (DNA packaging protein)
MKETPSEGGHTADEAAEHLFMSTRRFMELVAEGAIPRAQRKGYDLARCRKAYFKHMLENKTRRDLVAASSLVGARAALTREQTIAAELRNAIASGDFVERRTVTKHVKAELAAVNKRVLVIRNIAPSIEFKPRNEVENALRTEIHAALTQMHDPDDAN